jgi:phosphotransferase system HPr-like phosphotransfer protein
MLAATCGTRLKIRAEGVDARKAIASLQELLDQIVSDVSSQSGVGQKDDG